jgi:hypothetical protein
MGVLLKSFQPSACALEYFSIGTGDLPVLEKSDKLFMVFGPRRSDLSQCLVDPFVPGIPPYRFLTLVTFLRPLRFLGRSAGVLLGRYGRL